MVELELVDADLAVGRSIFSNLLGGQTLRRVDIYARHINGVPPGKKGRWKEGEFLKAANEPNETLTGQSRIAADEAIQKIVREHEEAEIPSAGKGAYWYSYRWKGGRK